MKKILFLTHHLQIGGVEKSLIELLRYLPASEYDITIRCVSDSGPLRSAVPSHCRVETMEYISAGIGDNLRLIKRGKLCLALKGLLCRFRQCLCKGAVGKLRVITRALPTEDEVYDYAVSYDAPNSLQVVYTIENVKAKTKYCWIHFNMNQSSINSYDSSWQEIYGKYDKLVCVSSSAEQALLEAYPHLSLKTCVINNVVDTDYIRNMAKESADIDRKDDETIICTAGRLSLGKGYLLALEACKRLSESGRKFRWFVVGEGKSRSVIEEKIAQYGMQDKFILLGAQLNPYKYMNEADIYVQPSKNEGQCITLSEARILEKAIICTDFQSAYEQIKDGHNGIIVPYDAEALYDAVCRLIDLPQERKRLSDNTDVPDNSTAIRKLTEIFK